MNAARPPADADPSRLLEMAKITIKDFTFGGTAANVYDIEVDVFPGDKSVDPTLLVKMMHREMPLDGVSLARRPPYEVLACAVCDLVRTEFSPMSVLVTVTQQVTNKITAVAVAAWSVEVPGLSPAPLNNLGVFRG